MVNRPLTLLEWKLLQWMAKPFYRDAMPSFKLSNGRAYFHPDNDSLRLEARNAHAVLIEMGWTTEPDNFGNIRLNEAGFKAASAISKPEWIPPNPPSLNDRDMDVLLNLEFASRGGKWATPLDCGGQNGSYHSASLVKLVHNGLAECRQRGGDKVYCGAAIVPAPSLFKSGKGSRAFRITPAGIAAHAEFKKQVALAA